MMLTLCIRYRLDPAKLAAFRIYAEALRHPVNRCGGRFVDYYLPTKLAGPTDTGIGLIDFPDLATYERYRLELARDPEGVKVARAAEEAGCILGEERSFLDRAGDVGASPAKSLESPAPPQGGQTAPPQGGHTLSSIERMYFAWDEALASNDPERLLALYAKDAEFESPVAPHLLGIGKGALRGHEELRPLFHILAKRKPKIRQYFRTGYLTDGKRVMWEYPRAAPHGDQMDFVEVMELNGEGLIQKHRVYWGWLGFGVLDRDEYRTQFGRAVSIGGRPGREPGTT